MAPLNIPKAAKPMRATTKRAVYIMDFIMTKEHHKVRKVLKNPLGTHSQGGINRNAPALRGVSSNWKKPHHALFESCRIRLPKC